MTCEWLKPRSGSLFDKQKVRQLRKYRISDLESAPVKSCQTASHDRHAGSSLMMWVGLLDMEDIEYRALRYRGGRQLPFRRLCGGLTMMS